MSFIESQAQSFWEAMNDKIMNILIKIIDEKINFEECVKLDNEKYLKEYNELIASLTDMSDEDKAEIIPQTVILNSPIEHFNYSFDKLLALWFTILHDTDSKWEMTVKIFELKETYNYKFKNTYSIDLQELK